MSELKTVTYLPKRYLQFSLGKENYGMELLVVKEVIPIPDTTPLPNCPSYYVGIMNLRGQIISILDLRKRLNVSSKRDDVEEAVIIVEIDGIGIGVVVDYIGKVLNITEKDISEIPEVSKQINSKYIEGVFKDTENLTIFLDIESILNIDELKKIQKTAA